jgi:predicted ABC-type ATPase
MYMIAGPNGAGKSTLYRQVLQPRAGGMTFVNADHIQREELDDGSMLAAYRAAEIAEQRRQDYLREGRSFITESTFSHPSKLALVESARAAGFDVVIFHVNVRQPDLSVARVAQRVLEGEHDVPEDKIRERYDRNPPLIRQAALAADQAFVYDNSRLNQPMARVLALRQGRVVVVGDDLPAWARTLYAPELAAHQAAMQRAG